MGERKSTLETLVNFYKQKKILITGHTGFKGTWLSLWLLKLGAKVVGYSLEPPTEPSLFEILKLKDKITHVVGDIRDIERLKYVLKKYEPEIIFHLAAQSLVRLSYRYPIETYETNVMGTLNLFESIRESKSVKIVINVTSDKCYENKEWDYAYRENDILGGYDPYSSSKACSEILTSCYRSSFFNPEDYGKKHNISLASVRAGNVVGGGDWQKDRLIPDCIKSLSKGKSIIIRNPNAIRPWQHVLEPLSGYLLLCMKMWKEPKKYCEAWNFGPYEANSCKVIDVVKKVIKFWGNGELEINDAKDYHEAKILKLDIGKAIYRLGWQPKWDIDTTLEKTVTWYKCFYSGKNDMFEYSLKDIDAYVEGK